MSTRHTTFRETMEGAVRIAGENRQRPIRCDLRADLPGVLRPWSDLEGPLAGHIHIAGWADDPGASGTIRVAPLAARRIRYQLTFTSGDGRRLQLDGWKSIGPRRPVRSMTHLPATITDSGGTVVGEARLSFGIRRDLASFLAGFRFPVAEDHFRSRWRGQPGRLEVWYTTLTDPATGAGVWIHHELVAPADGSAAWAHGWTALFLPGERPVLARFGPASWAAPDSGFACDGVEVTATRLRGQAAELSWDLIPGSGGAPLFTFPRWAWRRELLPAAQIVPHPAATFTGTVRQRDRVLELAGAPGATARIYGHGNPRRWAWLHADLGGGDICEVVAAVSTRPGLDRLPPLPFVRLRIAGRDWPPGGALASAARMRAQIGLPRWTVRGRFGGRRLQIDVTQPPAETVTVDYSDPDGAPAVCHNSERATAVITLSRRSGAQWVPEHRWRLEGTAHAEVGMR